MDAMGFAQMVELFFLPLGPSRKISLAHSVNPSTPMGFPRRFPRWNKDHEVRTHAAATQVTTESRKLYHGCEEELEVAKTFCHQPLGGFHIFFLMFTPTWGSFKNLTHVFQMGWNYQVDESVFQIWVRCLFHNRFFFKGNNSPSCAGPGPRCLRKKRTCFFRRNGHVGWTLSHELSGNPTDHLVNFLSIRFRREVTGMSCKKAKYI